MRVMKKLLLVMLAALSCAQAHAEEYKPTVTVAAFTGGAAVFTRGESDEYIQARGQINVKLSKRFVAFGRGELLGTQDGGSLDTFPDPSQFHSVEVLLGARYGVTERFSVGALGGVSFSAETDDANAPADPRLWTALAVARAGLGKLGYAYFGGGHYGQVGGAAIVTALQIPVTGDEHAYTFFDFALPLQYNVFNEKTWVMRTGVTVKLGEWEIE